MEESQKHTLLHISMSLFFDLTGGNREVAKTILSTRAGDVAG